MTDVLGFITDQKDEALNILIRILTAIVIWIIGRWLIKKAVIALEHAMRLSKQDPTISAFAANVAGGALKVLLAITVIGTAGFDTGPFTALIAGAVFAIAYSFQDSLGHVAAGISLLYLKQIRNGDLVKAADVTGRVEKVEVFFSQILASNGRKYYCPNGNVIGGPIHNVTMNKYIRAEMEFEVSNEYDLGEVRNFLVDAMVMNAVVEPEPEPDVVVSSINDETLTLLARAWVPADQYLSYRHNFLFDVYVRFNRSPLSLILKDDDDSDGGSNLDDDSASAVAGAIVSGMRKAAGGDELLRVVEGEEKSAADADGEQPAAPVRKVRANNAPD